MSKDTVSLRDVYNAVGELRKEMSGRIDKIETRVEGVESFKDKVLGYVAGVGFLVTTIVSLVINLVWKKTVGE